MEIVYFLLLPLIIFKLLSFPAPWKAFMKFLIEFFLLHSSSKRPHWVLAMMIQILWISSYLINYYQKSIKVIRCIIKFIEGIIYLSHLNESLSLLEILYLLWKCSLNLYTNLPPIQVFSFSYCNWFFIICPTVPNNLSFKAFIKKLIS